MTVINLKEKQLEEKEFKLDDVHTLIMSIRNVNSDVEPIFNKLKEQLGEDTRTLPISDLRHLRTSVNILSSVLDDLIE